jgi:hypothetical protein
MRTHSLPAFLIVLFAAAVLAACSPKFNWRDYRSPDAPYAVMFPDKPASTTRDINLGGLKVSMTMTAAQVDGAMFAVGTGEAPDEAQAQAAVGAMKTAMVNNIGATVTKDGATASGTAANGQASSASALDIEATGVSNGKPMLLIGHFEARGKRFYQVIVMGPKQAVMPEQVEQFMTSFKLN